MNTIVYFIRHSEPLKVNDLVNSDSLQLINEKRTLSIKGELLAKQLSEKLENVDVVYSSNYVRAIATAKYIANKNDLELIINENFGERKHGVDSWSELPKDYEKIQLEDENYKIGMGESQKDTRIRMYNSLVKILDENRGKKIAIVTHATAMAFLFKIWCDVKYAGDYSFNNNVFFDGNWNYVETFKLEFDDNNNLINITNENFI